MNCLTVDELGKIWYEYRRKNDVEIMNAAKIIEKNLPSAIYGTPAYSGLKKLIKGENEKIPARLKRTRLFAAYLIRGNPQDFVRREMWDMEIQRMKLMEYTVDASDIFLCAEAALSDLFGRKNYLEDGDYFVCLLSTRFFVGILSKEQILYEKMYFSFEYAESAFYTLKLNVKDRIYLQVRDIFANRAFPMERDFSFFPEIFIYNPDLQVEDYFIAENKSDEEDEKESLFYYWNHAKERAENSDMDEREKKEFIHKAEQILRYKLVLTLNLDDIFAVDDIVYH